jgi:carboxylesterase
MKLESLQLFTGEEHQPFLWPGGRPAALLLHGFPGTPAEVRPLAEVLHQAGWTAQGLLLPGFGPDIPTLFERDYREWNDAAAAALADLQNRHRPVILAGFSMGAAVALNVAAERPPDGLVLVSPFWRLGTRTQYIIWQGLKHIFRHFQPFRKADFSDPQMQAGFANFGGELDLSNPEVQEALRELRVPARLLDQVFATGRSAKEAAGQVSIPTLIFQGMHDDLVRPALTRQLLQTIPGPLAYEELAAGHHLLDPATDSWPQVTGRVLAFAGRIVESAAQGHVHDS